MEGDNLCVLQTYWQRLRNTFIFLKFHYTDFMLTRPIIMPVL